MSAAPPEAAADAGERLLRIATLNCLNYTAAGRSAYPGLEPLTAVEYDARVEWLARMLDRLDADLVLLQEIFDAGALAAAAARAAADLVATAPLATVGNTRPRLGLVWRRGCEPTRVDSVEDFPAGCAVAVPEAAAATAFSRPLLRARFALDGLLDGPPGPRRSLSVFNVHLKSRRPVPASGGPQAADAAAAARSHLRALLIRGAEASALRALVVAALAAGDAVVVGGDFNDEAAAVTTGIVSGAAAGAEGLGPDAATLYDALDLAPALPAGAAAPTYIDGGRAERIDHLLVSHHFAPGTLPGAGAYGRVVLLETLGDHLQARRRPAQGAGTADPARIAPDHAALCATLALRRD